MKKISEKGNPCILEYIAQKKIDIVINIPHEREGEDERRDGYLLRRATVTYGVPLITNLELAHALRSAIKQEHEKSGMVELGSIFEGKSSKGQLQKQLIEQDALKIPKGFMKSFGYGFYVGMT